MKHTVLFILLTYTMTLYTGTYASAQGFYAKVGGGYGIGSNKGAVNSYFQREILVSGGSVLMEQSMTNFSDDDNNVYMKALKESLGRGGNFGVAGGYMFSRHIGAELGLSYFLGQEVKSFWNVDGEPIFLVEKKKADMLLINPSLMFSVGTERVSPYARVGVLIGVAPKIKSMVTVDNTQDFIILEDELTGGAAIGFSTAVGLSYPINPMISIFGELVYNSLSYKPTSREVTKVIVNGEVTGLYASQKQPIKDVLPNTYASQSFDATEQLSHSYPFSNLGLNAGVRFNFGGSGLARGR